LGYMDDLVVDRRAAYVEGLSVLDFLLIHDTYSQDLRKSRLKRTFGSFFQKWTFELPMNRVVSRRHVFEANTNRFTLVPQIHPAKSVDDLRQEASISQR
jgi:hypothetical protein